MTAHGISAILQKQAGMLASLVYYYYTVRKTILNLPSPIYHPT